MCILGVLVLEGLRDGFALFKEMLGRLRGVYRDVVRRKGWERCRGLGSGICEGISRRVDSVDVTGDMVAKWILLM